MKNNTFHLNDINLNTLRQKLRLRDAFIIMLFVLPFLSGCGSAFITSKQDDVITQIDVWSEANEYGKAFATLDYVKPKHPQYQKLQLRKITLLAQAKKYEQHIDKQVIKYIKADQWAQALDLLDQAKENYPQSKAITNTEKRLLEQQQKLLASIDKNILLQRSQWMIKTRPVYEEKLNTDPRNKSVKIQLDDLNKESKILAQNLTVLSQQAIKRKHYITAKTRINQAITLEPSEKRQEILSQLKSRAKKSYAKKKQTENRTHKIQQDTLTQEIKQSFADGDFLKTKQLMLKLDKNEENDLQLITLKQELDSSVNEKIRQLQYEANKNYTDGQFHQAINLWRQVLIYDPQNTLAEKNIQRAEKVIDKLNSIREKQ